MQKQCYFHQQSNVAIDYKNIEILRRFISSQAKIMPPKRTGLCRKHQSLIAQAIKRARFMALLPYTNLQE
ncbi:MAG: 30S ribosomal protein S18 [Parcubacteria group bacterium]|nr:30S ribosomal protein S18 [Parcubacteria group bacterium]